MKLMLNLAYPQQQTLEVEPKVDRSCVEVIDRHRATCTDECIITIDNTFGEGNIVPDVDRYRIRRDGEGVVLRPHQQCTVAHCSNRYNDVAAVGSQGNCDKTIVIVLESPHEDEYLRNAGQPIAPAQGVTGRNLRRHLYKVLRSCCSLHCSLRAGTSRLILSNPVQFQASLVSVIDSGKQWHKIRNAVWRKLWNYRYDTTPQDCGGQTASGSFPIRDCFKNRLARYSPNYIINACTSSFSTNVSDFLKSLHFPDMEGLYQVCHPSSWNSERNRQLHRLS